MSDIKNDSPANASTEPSSSDSSKNGLTAETIHTQDAAETNGEQPARPDGRTETSGAQDNVAAPEAPGAAPAVEEIPAVQDSQLPSYMRGGTDADQQTHGNAARPGPSGRTLGDAVARGSAGSIPPFADIAVTPEGVAEMQATPATGPDINGTERSPDTGESTRDREAASGAPAEKNAFWTTRLRPDADEEDTAKADPDTGARDDSYFSDGEYAYATAGGDAYTAQENARSDHEKWQQYAQEQYSRERAGGERHEREDHGGPEDGLAAEAAASGEAGDATAPGGKGKGFFKRGKQGSAKAPREKRPGFFSTHPKLAAEQSMPASISSRLFSLLALMPILPLTVLLVAQVAFSLDARDLWYSDEIRHADAFRNLLNNGSWFVLHMNGEIYPDKPPLYFWFLRGLYELLQQEGPMLYFGAAALSGLLFLWASIFLGRFVARVDARTMLASGILLLCSGFVMGLLHYARMDLLFSALVVCSYAAFYHAWVRPQSISCMLLAFIFGALAVLTKGPLGLALPLGASVLFLIWRGTPLRLFRWDTLLGLLVGAVIIGSWAGAASLELGGHEQFIDLYITKQTIGRVFDAFHHQQPWYYYLAGLPLMVLPWTLLIFALPWLAPFGKKWWQGLAASRKPEAEGLGYMWCIVFSALAILSLISGKLLIYFLPALPALCIIMGRAVLQLSPRRAGFFRHTLALLLLLLGLAFIAATLMLFGYLPVPDIKGIPGWRLPPDIGFFAVGGGLVITAFFLWLLLHSSRPEGVLLVTAACFTLMSFPLAVMVAPAFDSVLSPKAQALVMKDLASKGYTPVSFKDYGGTYSYYAGRTITETKDRAAVQAMAAQKNIALAVRSKDWEEWENRPAGCTVAHSQWIETKVHLLLACTPTAVEPPTTVPPATNEQDPPAATPGQETVSPTPEQEAGSPVTEQDATPPQPEGLPESDASGPEAAGEGSARTGDADSGNDAPAQVPSEQVPAQPSGSDSGQSQGQGAPAASAVSSPDAGEPAPAPYVTPPAQEPTGRTLGDWQSEEAAPEGEQPREQ